MASVDCFSIGFPLCLCFVTLLDARYAYQVMKALERMTRGVQWGALDVLVVDMPPGTGDAQISISQRLQLSGSHPLGIFVSRVPNSKD